MQRLHVYGWRLHDQGAHRALKCRQRLLLSKRLREIVVMSPGAISFPGIELSDSIQGSPASFPLTGSHARTRSDDIVYGFPNELSDGHTTCPCNSSDLFCLLLGELYLCSNHTATYDYRFYIMISDHLRRVRLGGASIKC
jgi:hypothetical protein